MREIEVNLYIIGDDESENCTSSRSDLTSCKTFSEFYFALPQFLRARDLYTAPKRQLWQDFPLRPKIVFIFPPFQNEFSTLFRPADELDRVSRPGIGSSNSNFRSLPPASTSKNSLTSLWGRGPISGQTRSPTPICIHLQQLFLCTFGFWRILLYETHYACRHLGV